MILALFITAWGTRASHGSIYFLEQHSSFLGASMPLQLTDLIFYRTSTFRLNVVSGIDSTLICV